MIAQNDSTTIQRKLPMVGEYSMARTASGVFMARWIISCGSNIQKVTKRPTARKATSLTMDSVATANISPCWCSVASAWRVPNSTANTAIASVTISAISPMIGILGEGLILAQDNFERGGHRLELQRDIGHRSDDRDQRDGSGDRLALAVARADEVGDRGDVLAFGELDHAAQQRRAQPDHQDRADIDREEIDAGAGGKADRAEEGPGRAVDRQR